MKPNVFYAFVQYNPKRTINVLMYSDDLDPQELNITKEKI